jgi:hypothetical protein
MVCNLGAYVTIDGRCPPDNYGTSFQNFWVDDSGYVVTAQGGDPLNRQFNQIEIEAVEVRALIQRQSTEDVFNVNSIHVNAELTLKYVDG